MKIGAMKPAQSQQVDGGFSCRKNGTMDRPLVVTATFPFCPAHEIALSGTRWTMSPFAGSIQGSSGAGKCGGWTSSPATGVGCKTRFTLGTARPGKLVRARVVVRNQREASFYVHPSEAILRKVFQLPPGFSFSDPATPATMKIGAMKPAQSQQVDWSAAGKVFRYDGSATGRDRHCGQRLSNHDRGEQRHIDPLCPA